MVERFRLGGQKGGRKVSTSWSKMWSKGFDQVDERVVERFLAGGRKGGRKISSRWSKGWSKGFDRVQKCRAENACTVRLASRAREVLAKCPTNGHFQKLLHDSELLYRCQIIMQFQDL